MRSSARMPRFSSLLGSGAILRLLLELAGGLLVLLADLVELPHVLKEVGAPLQGDEELGLLAVASVVRGLNCDGLGSDFLESGVVVPIQRHLRVSQEPKDADVNQTHSTSNRSRP